jgi:uncharacterized membrane protein
MPSQLDPNFVVDQSCCDRLSEPDCVALSDRFATSVSAAIGSWSFILWQAVVLGLWFFLNSQLSKRAWDPYPFILLNLVLSFVAAYTAPIIMMRSVLCVPVFQTRVFVCM